MSKQWHYIWFFRYVFLYMLYAWKHVRVKNIFFLNFIFNIFFRLKLFPPHTHTHTQFLIIICIMHYIL